MPRTEEEKTIQAPIKITLGETEYSVKPLRVLKAREWRSLVEKELGPMVAKIQLVKIGERVVVAGLPTAVTMFPEKICDLVFAYASDLSRDRILAEATEEQIVIAFSRFWEVAFANFLPQMALAKEMLNPPSPSASVNSSN